MIMNYKSVIVLILGVSLKMSAVELSESTNGVYLAVAGYRQSLGVVTNEPIRFDDSLVFLTYSESGHITLSYPIDPAYGIKLNMIGPDGKSIPKTDLGKRFGSKFTDFHSVTDTRLYPVEAWGTFRDNPTMGGAKFFPGYAIGGSMPEISAKDLFDMNETGQYILEVQMQMARFDSKSTNVWSREVFCFPNVRIRVEKSPKE
jgi:hypothetical protein